jgi:hypothetical protein
MAQIPDAEGGASEAWFTSNRLSKSCGVVLTESQEALREILNQIRRADYVQVRE